MSQRSSNIHFDNIKLWRHEREVLESRSRKYTLPYLEILQAKRRWLNIALFKQSPLPPKKRFPDWTDWLDLENEELRILRQLDYDLDERNHATIMP